MKTSESQDRILKLQNLVRGAHTNLKKQSIVHETLNHARKELVASDAKTFLSLLNRKSLTETIYGEDFPDTAKTIFRVYKTIDPIELNTEALIQAFRIIDQ